MTTSVISSALNNTFFEAVENVETEEIECAAELGHSADGNLGKILEASIPHSRISVGEDGMLAFNAVL